MINSKLEMPRKLFLGIIFLFSSIFPLSSCTHGDVREDGGEQQRPVSLTFKLVVQESPLPSWTGKDKVRIMQIAKGKVLQFSDCYIMPGENDAIATASASFDEMQGDSFTYTAVFPASLFSGTDELSLPSSQTIDISGDFTSACDILAGRSDGLNILMKRVGSILNLTVKDIPKNCSYKGMQIDFPSAAFGRISIDPLTGLLNDWSKAQTSSLLLNIPNFTSTGNDSFKCRYLHTWSGDKEVKVLIDTETGYYLGKGVLKGSNLTVSVEEAFKNPVTSFSWPDPTIWYDDSAKCFFSIATSVRDMKKSIDGINWVSTGISPLTVASKAQALTLGKHMWAPDVAKIGDALIMYLTSINTGTDSRIAAYGYNPSIGQFEYLKVVTDGNDTGIADTIDAEVVIDPDSGKTWLFFGSIGKMHRVELTKDGTSVAPGAKYVHVAGVTSAENPARDKVFEGAYLYHREGYWYLFASGGRYADHSYKIVVGRSAFLEGAFFTKDGKAMTKGEGTVILSSDKGDEMFGPGHNGEIFTDDTGQDYMYFHCHDSSLPPNSNRYMFLQRIFWDSEGWPYFEEPKPLRYDKKPQFNN